MKKNKNNKELMKARKVVKNTSKNENCGNLLPQSDVAISTNSTSIIVSSLFLSSLAVIIMVLAFVFGFVPHVYSYNHNQKSGFVSDSDFDDFVYYQEDMVHHDDDYISSSESNDYYGDNSVGHMYMNDANEKDNKAEQHSGDTNTLKSTPKKKMNKRVMYLDNRDLLKDYTFNYEKALKIRERNMKKYSYPYLTDGVDKRSNLSLQEFYDVYDAKWPVIITDVVKTWPASAWSWKTMKADYGDARVAMVSFSNQNGKKNKEGFSVPLGIFLEHINMSSFNTWTYVQDETFLVQYPELRAHVLDTIYSKEDFFTLFPKDIRPWDCLLLWGTANSRSTLHIDPYNWTGTNAVIFGHKKWKLVLPGQDIHLSIYPDASCGFPLDCNKYNSKYDTYSTSDQIKRKLKKLKYLEVDQFKGEMLFIPTGWFHQAFNVVPTLAVSGEIMNHNNYLAVLEEIFLARNLPRSVLPYDVETMSPHRLVEFVMSKIPGHILHQGAEWTKMTMAQMYNESNAVHLQRKDNKH